MPISVRVGKSNELDNTRFEMLIAFIRQALRVEDLGIECPACKRSPDITIISPNVVIVTTEHGTTVEPLCTRCDEWADENPLDICQRVALVKNALGKEES